MEKNKNKQKPKIYKYSLEKKSYSELEKNKKLYINKNTETNSLIRNKTIESTSKINLLNFTTEKTLKNPLINSDKISFNGKYLNHQITKQKKSDKNQTYSNKKYINEDFKENFGKYIPTNFDNSSNNNYKTENNSLKYQIGYPYSILKEEEYNFAKNILKKVFLNFSKFHQEVNEYFLSYTNFLKILKISDVMGKNLTLNKIDLISQNHLKTTKKIIKLTFMDFYNLIQKICIKTMPNFLENPTDSLILFIKNKLAKILSTNSYKSDSCSNLYIFTDEKNETNSNINNIEVEFKLGNELRKKPSNTDLKNYAFLEKFILEFKFDNKIKIIIISILPGLVNIYKSYFYFEVNKFSDIKKITNNSFDSMIKFLKDFSIIPYEISYDLITNYWNLIIFNEKILNFYKNNLDYNKSNLFHLDNSNKDVELNKLNNLTKKLKCENLGKIFTFYNFCLLLVHISDLSNIKYDFIKKENFYKPISEKLLYFLEKLNSCTGYLKFEKNISKGFNCNFKLIPSAIIMNRITPLFDTDKAIKNTDIVENKENYLDSYINNSIDLEKGNLKRFQYKKSNGILNLKNILCVENNLINIIQEKFKEIKEIFGFCCKQNIKGNNSINKLNFISFYNFLKESFLLKNSTDLFIKKKFVYSVDLSLLSDEDVYIIFSVLKNLKDFKKINYIQYLNSTKVEKVNNNIENLIDLSLFIKSFEFLALKLFQKNLNDEQIKNTNPNHIVNISMDKFLEFILPNIIFKFKNNTNEEIKSEYIEFIKQEKIVK